VKLLPAMADLATRFPDTLAPAQVFKALGHPARVEVIRELTKGERCVCELVEAVGLGWSTVSRHLSVLRQAGVIEAEKRGLQIFYRLELPCVARFIACLDNPAGHPDLMAPDCSCDPG
jgi:DNA-binding transcriptional ArsR family regulator